MISEHSNSLLTPSLFLCFFLLCYYDCRICMDLRVHHQRNMVKHLQYIFAYAALNFRGLILVMHIFCSIV